MKTFKKKKFPVEKNRRFLEPGPIVLVSSEHKGKQNIMTMGWHTVMEFTPALVGCIVASSNYSYDLIRKSKECVINIPTVDLAHKVTAIGNCSGKEVNKFKEFGLTALQGTKISAPLIKECYANFECRLYDSKLVNTYNFFIWEVVNAQVAVSPKYPETIHYRGNGIFMLLGNHLNLKREFKRDRL